MRVDGSRTDSPAHGSRATGAAAHWAWTAAVVLLAALVAFAAERSGAPARGRPALPPALEATRWGIVDDAAGAARAWSALALRGRTLVLFTGRWPALRGEDLHRARQTGGAPGGHVTPDTAVLAATLDGVVRRLVVVMPPRAWQARLEAVAGAKQLVRDGRCFSLPFDALERRFCAAGAASPPGEPALVLIEPSFFAEPGTTAVDGWATGGGVALGLVATRDPVAGAPEREAAARLAAAVGAVPLESAR